MATIYSKFIDIANTVAGEDVSANYPRTVAGAIDALSEALAGAPVDSGKTIADAVAALKPYIGGSPVLVEKYITENDTYDPADDNADGYSSVEVNVSGGGGADLGELVTVKASASLEDFGFEVWIGDSFVTPSYADTEGTIVAAGASVYVSVSDESRTGTYKIGSAEPVAMEFASIGIAAYRWFTIPVDTPAQTLIEVDGQF